MASMASTFGDAAFPGPANALALRPVLPPGLTAVYERVLATVLGGECALLVGATGAGKTTLLQAVDAALRQKERPVALLTAADTLPGRTVTLLMDDAHQLAPAVWEQVTRRGGGWVLAGLPSLLQRPPGSRRRALALPLPGLAPVEMPGFVADVLRQIGERASLVPVSTVAAVYEAAGQLPGRVAGVVRLAVFLAQLEGVATVEPHHIQQAVRLGSDEADTEAVPVELTEFSVRPARRRVGMAAALATAGLAALVVPWALPPFRHPAPRSPPPAVAPAPERATLDVPAPATELPLPLPEPLHLAVLYAGDDPEARSRAQTIAQQLRSRGAVVADPVRSSQRMTGIRLHFFFTQDADAANALAESIGVLPSSLGLVDANPRNPPRPGSMEILVGSPAWNR